MEIGRKILSLRKEKRWTQQQLAEKLNVTDKAVSKWEQGLGLPDIENVVLLSQVFDVTTDYLLKDNKVKVASDAVGSASSFFVISAHTHAEFLNALLGKKYKQYRKCTCRFDENNSNNIIWMINLDDEVSSSGWENRMMFADAIFECYVGKESECLDTHKILPENEIRYVFDIFEGEDDEDLSLRYYEFKGVFKLLIEESDRNRRVWKRINTTATINGDTCVAKDRKETYAQFLESTKDVAGEIDIIKGIL